MDHHPPICGWELTGCWSEWQPALEAEAVFSREISLIKIDACEWRSLARMWGRLETLRFRYVFGRRNEKGRYGL
jgi:hypothetical protein